MLELLVTRPEVNVADAEFRRLLGYPPHHVPSARAQELAAWARHWYGQHGRPWIYVREVNLTLNGALRFDGAIFDSPQLREHFARTEATRAVLFAVSAGTGCEEHARELWEESKPDEYFFLETFGSAVVEHLVATTNGRVCAQAESEGLVAIPHYSPGYGGWNVEEQNALFDQIRRGRNRPFPDAIDVLPSGMVKPKKSLLGVIGLAPQTAANRARAVSVPCENCSLGTCQFRCRPYRHAVNGSAVNGVAVRQDEPETVPLAPAARYSVNARALQKWSQERVRLEPAPDGGVVAWFRFDGTTCSNMGRPLSFEYRVVLSSPRERYLIRRADCRPTPGDDGYQAMCEYMRDPLGLMDAITREVPLVGCPLDDVLSWERRPAPNGCYCDADSRAHKWGLALEVIHYALAQHARPAGDAAASASFNPLPRHAETL